MTKLTYQRRLISRLGILAAIAVWFGVLGVGFGIVWAYATTPGSPGHIAAHWPADTAIRPAPRIANLIMFAHPRCPCTRASLEELAEIVQRHGARLQTRVLFFEPVEASDEWRNTAHWRFVQSTAGIEALPDPGGREARRFGGRTSGHALLYDMTGRLIFSGGITPMRGERGGNPGGHAVSAWLAGQPVECATSDVFGCPLESVDEP